MSGRQQPVSGILWSNQYDVKTPSQRPVLETIIQQMKMGAESCLCKVSCFVSIFADDYRNLEFARDKQRFIPKLLWQSCGIDEQHASRLPPVAAREYIELHAACLEQLAQKQDEWRLARSTRGKIAHTDHRSFKPS